MSYKVLLIDDNEDMLFFGQKMFHQAGYHCLTAESAVSGLEQALQHAPDALVLDYHLPDMTGTRLIETIATDDVYATIRHTPSVILTARPDYIEDADACFKYGMRALLRKPFGQRELINVVENIIRENRSRHSDASADNPFGSSVDGKDTWLEDVKVTAATIAGLSRELVQNKRYRLGEKPRMDINAIYTSSRRLIQLLKEHTT